MTTRRLRFLPLCVAAILVPGAVWSASDTPPTTAGAAQSASDTPPTTAGAAQSATDSPPTTAGAAQSASDTPPTTAGAAQPATDSPPTTAGAAQSASDTPPTTATGSATAPQPKPLTLPQAINVALQNQINIISARNNVAIAQSRKQQALSAYLPQLTLQNNAFQVGSGGVLNRSTTGTAIGVTQNIWDGGIREANVAGSRYGVVASTAGYTRTAQSVIFNVTTAYYDALRSQHLADVAQANVKYSEELKAQVEYQAEIGTVAKADVLPVEAQLASARVALLSAQNSVRTSLIQLQNSMGVSPQPGFAIEDVGAPAEEQIQPLDQYVATAITSRPDILQAQANLGSARSSVKAARIQLYPRPVISGEYQRGISGGFSDSGGQIVGGIAFDIFDGGANRAAYKAAKASQDTARAEADQVLKDIRAQVEEAYLNLTSAKERLTASDLGLAAAQLNYEAQRERYNQGVGITLDLLNAELQLVTAQTDQVQARYDYYNALSQLNFAIGRTDTGTYTSP